MMLIKPTIALLSATIYATELAGANSTTTGKHVQEDSIKIESAAAASGLPGTLRRRMKKDKDKNKDKDDEEEIDEKSAEDLFIEVDGDEDVDEVEDEEISASSFVPDLQSFANIMDDSPDWHHGTYTVSSERSESIELRVPMQAKSGDTLFLFLSITDGQLPLELDDDEWERGAECFKSYNRQSVCMREVHCVRKDDSGKFCNWFKRGDEEGTGRDLATVLFHRKVTNDTPGCFTIDLPRRSTTWAALTVITNVNDEDPIRTGSVAGRSCDKEWGSAFPSVYGEENDVLLLSQCFDDTANKSDFRPPPETELLGFTKSSDEAGFLFGKELDKSGQTGRLVTGGVGGPKCKDALLSVVVNRD